MTDANESKLVGWALTLGAAWFITSRLRDEQALAAERVAYAGAYGVGFDVRLDCCWSRKQRNRVRKRLNRRISHHRTQMNRALGRDRGGLEMMRRARVGGATYMWEAARQQKRMNKRKRYRRKSNSCKKFPCFPSSRRT